MPIKSTTLTFLSFLLSLTAYAQIQNAGFDQQSAGNSNPVAPWNVKTVEGYKYELDNSNKHSGTSALKISAKEPKKGTYQPFSQQVPIEVKHLKRIAVTAYIKCEDVMGESTLWCQVWDENNKQIGFQNLGGQGIKIAGTAGWKKYSMPITVNVKAKKLLLGGYLNGSGAAWFDDFEVEDLSISSAPASELVTTYIKEFISIVKHNSIYTDSLKWPAIETDVVALSAGMNTIAEARPVLDYIIDQLRAVGDNHSFIQNKVAAERYTKENSNPEKPVSRLLPGKIAYVYVPGFTSTNEEVSTQFATDIQNMIRKLDTENQLAGWIVDLRGNTGGNMYPMIAGLGPLTGEGTLGYFSKASDNKEKRNPWIYKKGKSGTGSRLRGGVVNPYKLKNKDAKVAVLIGKRTSSSGEMTAISFIGRKNAKLFGTRSGGYTTANGMYKLSDGANLLLASSYTSDRNMKGYMKFISPDVEVTPGTDGSDADIKAAETWLLNNLSRP